MYCKYLSKALNGKIKCRKHKTYIISLDFCKNCSERNVVVNKGIKKKSNKLAKLERNRDKELIKKGICEYCKRYSERLDPHEVYGGCNRQRSIRHKFVALICRECHQNEKVIQELKIKYQKEFEKQHTREDFIQIIGKSFIKGDDK